MNSIRLSPTKISTYLKCPASYRYRYETSRQEELNPWMARGIAVHSAAEAWHRARMQKQEIPLDKIAKIAEHAFDAELKRFPYEDRKRFDNIMALRLDSRTMARCYCRNLGKSLDATHVELEVERTLPSGIAVFGRIDLIENGKVRDIKTASRPPSGSEAVESIQLPAYAWMAGLPLPTYGFLDFVTTSAVFSVPTDITRESVDFFIAKAEKVAAGILAGDFPSTPINSGECLRCSFARECIPHPVYR